MGNECLSTTPNQKYSNFLKEIKVSQLKDLWQTVKIYKMKKLFDSVAQPDSKDTCSPYLTFEGFRQLFVELEDYPQQQVYRLYQIFDFQNIGHIDWNSFFSTITILYFGAERELALIMFMMFDHSLQLKLDNAYLKLMLETNEPYFKLGDRGQTQESSEIYHHLMSQEGFHVQTWLRQAPKIIDFSKFRKLFNVFVEERMEKELIRNFYDWNDICDSENGRFVGYLINLKWFQSWKLYVLYNYNINIDIYSLNKSSIKTVKTCKKTSNRRLQTIKLGIHTNRVIHGCSYIQIGPIKEENMRNIDCVHNHLGEKPREITNNQLEGEFEEVLREGVSQNMDYVIVSEKIWKNLKTIYDGFPQFRRTGFDSIELYPKIIKTYFSLFKEQIDYSTEVIRQVSAYLGVDQLLINSCQITETALTDKIIYYKAIGMQKWQELQNHTSLFTELSSQILIFLVCISNSDKQTFQKSHQKPPKNVLEVNLGDYVIYHGPLAEQKTVVFMGKSVEGKYILHFVGQSYTNDICLKETQMQKYCKLSSKLEEIEHTKHSRQNNLVGLPNGPGLGFINSVFQIFMNSPQMKKQLPMLDNNRSDKLIYCISRIQRLLLKEVKIQATDISDLIELFLSKYVNFEVGMSFNLLNDFYAKISAEMKGEKLPNGLESHQVQIEKVIDCTHCHKMTTYHEHCWALKVPIPEDKLRNYEVIWVPVKNKQSQIFKYKITVKKQATLMDFMNALEQQIGVRGKKYILAEVNNHDIIKNYHSAQRSATLANLRMRQTDQLYAYELQTDMKEFINQHFNNKSQLQQAEIKKNILIDCKHSERGWIFGKVIQNEYLPYTQTNMVKVLHKFNKNQNWQINYDAFEDNVARFPTKSYENCEQYHLRLQQRVFNEASNSMKLVNFPLIMVLPAWMRWNQFFYLVYEQVKQFIMTEYCPPVVNDQDNERSGSKSLRNNRNKTEIFKQYKSSSKFPYKLHLVDYEGRCAICYKFLKLTVFKGEHDMYCEGCQLTQTDPIVWQVKPADLLICIDWLGTDKYKNSIITESSSYIKKSIEYKKQEDSLLNCLNHMKEPSLSSEEAICCNIFSEKEITQKVVNKPEALTIYLERIVEEEDGFKKVIKKPIKFSSKQLLFEGNLYSLIGVTSIEGQNLNIKYKTYIFKEGEDWYEYDDKLVRLVTSSYVQKVCAFVLNYQKTS